MLLVLFDRKATSASDCTVPRCVHSRIGRGLQFSTNYEFSAARRGAGAGSAARPPRNARQAVSFVCVLSYDLPYSTGAPLDSCVVLNATASAWPRPTAHAVRKADTRQQTHVSCTSSHRASLDLPVKSYCVSSVLSSGAYRVAARLLLPLRRLHAFLAGEEASSCRTPHSTARRHVR